MKEQLHLTLKVRRATSLDRSALREWMRFFRLLVETEGHSALPDLASRPNSAAPISFVVLADAIRVAFVESSDSTASKDRFRIFVKPAAWPKLTRNQILDAVIAHSDAQLNPPAPPEPS
jgi:hypothetical protein